MQRTDVRTPRGESGRGGGGGGVMNWVIGIDMYTLMCIKWMTNKNLLYKKINKIKFKHSKKKKKTNIRTLARGEQTFSTPVQLLISIEISTWVWNQMIIMM